MKELTEKKCANCSLAKVHMQGDELKSYVRLLPEEWSLENERRLVRTFTFKTFKEGFKFASHIADLSEEEGHHPQILIEWGRVVVKLWTHSVEGLTESDFILAAKIETLHLEYAR